MAHRCQRLRTCDLRLATSDLRRTCDFRLRTCDLRLATSDFGLATYDLRLATSDFGLATSDLRLATSDFGLQSQTSFIAFLFEFEIFQFSKIFSYFCGESYTEMQTTYEISSSCCRLRPPSRNYHTSNARCRNECMKIERRENESAYLGGVPTDPIPMSCTAST